MKRRTYLALAAIAGLSITAAAVAQTPPFRRAPPSPETIQRLQDGKIAMAVTALKMNEAQLKLWGPVESQIRANQAARTKMMQTMMEARKANTPRPELARSFRAHGHHDGRARRAHEVVRRRVQTVLRLADRGAEERRRPADGRTRRRQARDARTLGWLAWRSPPTVAHVRRAGGGPPPSRCRH